jgi:succinyl-CoA synthetase beta subunit
LNLHEYQSKALFAEHGIPTPMGAVATTPDEAYKIAKEIGGAVVVKSQVLVGGRGKAGGVKVAKNAEEAREIAQAILGMDIKGHTVEKVLIDPASNIASEIYLGVTNDRAAGKPVIMASSEGGVEIEIVARENPDAIIKEHVDPLLGLRGYQITNIASDINLPREHWRAFDKIIRGLYACYMKNDAVLAEINPLVITGQNELVALDGKMIIDDNALSRHSELEEIRDSSADSSEEVQAREADLSYVKLGGQIGCMVNGAGLAMTTMDMTKLYGGNDYGPANFLDIGGGAKADKVAAALRIILADSNVKSVLFNIFGGIIARPLLALGDRQADLGVEELEPVILLAFALIDLLAAELAGLNRIEALDALRGIAVRDRLDLKRVQFAEVGHLIERQRGVLDQPNGGGFRHQGCGLCHGKSPLRSARPDGRSLKSSGMTGMWRQYMHPDRTCPMANPGGIVVSLTVKRRRQAGGFGAVDGRLYRRHRRGTGGISRRLRPRPAPGLQGHRRGGRELELPGSHLDRKLHPHALREARGGEGPAVLSRIDAASGGSRHHLPATDPQQPG